jgi:hypothetical protein
LDAGAEQQMRADLCDAMRALEVHVRRWALQRLELWVCENVPSLLWRTQATLRPSPTYMLDVQRDVNAAFREILVDWLVEVTAKFRCVPETLFLAVRHLLKSHARAPLMP